jgi:hypothetical protein
MPHNDCLDTRNGTNKEMHKLIQIFKKAIFSKIAFLNVVIFFLKTIFLSLTP